jgi:TolB-like protein/DNA-binding winged helix-turn-helix (wHTH) protein
MKLTFATCEMDTAARELRREGAPVHLEPQVFDLLVHLVRNHARVVSKDELLDVVWHGRIVSEAALSSIINAARRAIGDDGNEQKLIKTMHRRGFRFVGEVAEIPEEAPALVSALVSAPAPLAGLEQSVPDMENEIAVSAAEALAPPLPDNPSRKPPVAVLPFFSPGAEQETDYFTNGLTEDVVRLLSRHRWLDVLSRHSAVAFRGPDVDPREIGAALGIRYLVQGTVLRDHDRARISASLISAESGRHLWGARIHQAAETHRAHAGGARGNAGGCAAGRADGGEPGRPGLHEPLRCRTYSVFPARIRQGDRLSGGRDRGQSELRPGLFRAGLYADRERPPARGLAASRAGAGAQSARPASRCLLQRARPGASVP